MRKLDNKWKISKEDALNEYLLVKEKRSNLSALQRLVVVVYVESLDVVES